MAGFGFGEGIPSAPNEENKNEAPRGVRGLEDVAADALAHAEKNIEEADKERQRGEIASQDAGRVLPPAWEARHRGFDVPNTAREMGGANLEKEAKELGLELEKTPEKEREKIGVGFRNVGFFVEEAKNNFFAGVFNKMAETQPQKKSITTKFVAKLGEGFNDKAAKARERIEAIDKTKNRETLANAGYLLGNTIKYGRTVLDVAGVTVAAPLRFATMGAMAFSSGAEAAKEVRLENEKVIAKTRIEDADKAAEEAYEVYRTAMARSGGQPTGRDYEKAYHEILPGDLLRRLQEKAPEQPGIVNRFVQGVVKFQIERSVKKLVEKKDRIEGDPRFSGKQRDEKKRRLFNRFERRLRDYDRVVGQFGTVDALAMGARYAEVAGKVAAYVPTAYIALEKAFEMVGDTFSGVETSEAMEELQERASTIPPLSSVPPVIESGAAPEMQSQIIENLKAHVVTPETTSGITPGVMLETGPKVIPESVPAHTPGSVVSHETVSAHSAEKPIEFKNSAMRSAPPTFETAAVDQTAVKSPTPEQLRVMGQKEGATLTDNIEKTGKPPELLNDLYERHPEFKGSTEWKIGDSGLITREGYPGWYHLDDKGNLWYSGGRTANKVFGAQILKTGSAVWEKTDHMAAPATKEMMDAFGRVMTVEKGGSISAAAQEMVKAGQISDADFKAAWENPASVVKINGEDVHISKVGLSYEGNEVRFVPGEGGKAPHFEVLQGTGKAMGTDTDLYNRYGALGKKQPEWLQKSVLGITESEATSASEALPEKISAQDSLAHLFERTSADSRIEVKLPEWFAEKMEHAKLAETLPGKVADLEALRDDFGDYSLAAQERAMEQCEELEKQLDYLDTHADDMGLTPTQEEFVAMSKDTIAEMREMLKESTLAFKEELQEVGVSYAAYEKAIAGKGLAVKDLFEMEKKNELDAKKWGPFLKWIHALKPTVSEQGMKVDEFLRTQRF